MPRWYMGFRCYGKPQMILGDITKVVQRNNLGNIVPVVKVERSVQHGPFYLFAAIESSALGEVPGVVQSTLLHLPALKTRLPGFFTFEEIRGMVEGELDVHNYAPTIPYKHSQSLLDESPFDVVGEILDQHNEDDTLMQTQRHDRLMLWASAAGWGSWRTFRGACQILGLDRDGSQSRRIFRNLRLLGHAEVSQSGAYWSASPPVLVGLNLPGGESAYCLCGQRNIKMLQALHEVANVQSHPQGRGEAPAMIRVYTSDIQQVLSHVRESVLPLQLWTEENPSYRLAQIIPSIVGWKNGLGSIEGIHPEMFTVKRFNGSAFIAQPFQGEGGFYELWPLKDFASAKRPLYTLFYDNTIKRWLLGDWYGLRFLSSQMGNIPCPVRYESSTRRLAISRRWRWPELYERVLVLASGQLPAQNSIWLIYEAIEPRVFNELSIKLNLQREETSPDA